MGKFHDDLVEARRRGEMLTTPEPAPAAETKTAVPFRLPTFVAPSDAVPVVCTVCGALVDVQYTPHHVAEHARLSS